MKEQTVKEAIKFIDFIFGEGKHIVIMGILLIALVFSLFMAGYSHAKEQKPEDVLIIFYGDNALMVVDGQGIDYKVVKDSNEVMRLKIIKDQK